MSPVDQAKKALRSDLLAKRLAMPEATRESHGRRICGHLSNWIATMNVNQVGLFWPHKGEPDLRGLAGLVGKGVVLGLPVVAADGRSMRLHAWHPSDVLVANRYGIPEPDPKTAQPLELDASTAILVPATAIDRQGHRLGYGGGFYDRFLAATPALTVGIVFEQFLVETLPRESHDFSLRFVATENGISQVLSTASPMSR